MKPVNLFIDARWGNALFKYAYARGYCEKHGFELRTNPWIGQKIFNLNDPPIETNYPERYDMDLESWQGESEISLTGWGLHQKCLFYTRSKAKHWFKFRPEIESLLKCGGFDICAHIRHGDYIVMRQYVAIALRSYFKACSENALNGNNMWVVSEQKPTVIPELSQIGMDFLADFVVLMRSKIILRANSTFSWWAATLSDAEKILSPKLDGIEPQAGVLQEAPFVEGNHPAISCFHSNNSDLYLTP